MRSLTGSHTKMSVSKPIVTIGAAGGTVILTLAAFCLLRGGLSSPTIKGKLMPEEVRQIELAVQHHRWRILRSLISTRRFKMASEVCMDVVLGYPD